MNFIADPDRINIYTMRESGRQGVESDGIFFWHDYPMEEDQKTLAGAHAEELDRINQKYRHLWPRFKKLTTSDVQKTFVVSNTQFNLWEFSKSDDDFRDKFGLDVRAYHEIREALNSFGARNFKIRFVTQSLEDYLSCADAIGEDFECSFGGTLSLPAHKNVAVSLLDIPSSADVSLACGVYDNGSRWIEPVSDRNAIIYQRKDGAPEPWGALRAGVGGYTAVFSGRDRVFACAIDGDQLAFSNHTKWRRQS